MEPNESGYNSESIAFSLFAPRSAKDLRQYYPELARTREFEALNAAEMIFVWYYACQSSTIPYEAAKNKESRCMYAFEIAFGKKTINEELYAKYRALNFPERVRTAIERMERYEPDARNKARQMTIKMFDNLQKFSAIDIEDLLTVTVITPEGITTKTTDWSALKAYTDNVNKITTLLPELIKQLEEGFGVTDDKKKANGRSAIDRFHSSKNEN